MQQALEDLLCPTDEELLSAEDPRDQFKEHLRYCAVCRWRVEFIEAVKEGLRVVKFLRDYGVDPQSEKGRRIAEFLKKCAEEVGRPPDGFPKEAKRLIDHIRIPEREELAIGIMGPKREAPSEVVLVSPLFSGIRDREHLVFRWEDMRGAVEYRFRIQGPVETEEINTTSTSIPYPSSFPDLIPGKRYEWTVKGVDAQGAVVKVWKGFFWLLTESERERLEREEKGLPSVQKVALLNSAGLFEEATRSLLDLARSKSKVKRAIAYKGLLLVWRTIYDRLMEIRAYSARDALLQELAGLQEKLDRLIRE